MNPFAKAKWIENQSCSDQIAPVFYKQFELNEVPSEAVLFICGGSHHFTRL